MIHFDPQRVQDNVRQATTEDLLDRVTVYRSGMEPEAVDIIEAELRSRGVRREHIAVHAQKRETGLLRLPDGSAKMCSFCYRPAVGEGWGWHKLWGRVPVFPRRYAYCEVHSVRGGSEYRAGADPRGSPNRR